MDTEHEESTNPEIEQEARGMGWVPQDKFKGNPDHWVDAEEFVKRGQTLMPILASNNRRMKEELLSRDQKIDTLEQTLARTTQAMERLEQHYTAANKRAVENAKAQLKEELKQAREDRDVDAEFEILDKIKDVDKLQEELDKKPEEPAPKKDEPKPTLSPEVTAWMAENDWYNKDKTKTKHFNRVAEDLRDDGSELTGREFLEEAMRIYEETYGEGEAPKRPVSKVQATPARSGGASSKGYAALPPEAKAACDADAELFVGPNMKYKTIAEWRAQYSKIYFSET